MTFATRIVAAFSAIGVVALAMGIAAWIVFRHERVDEDGVERARIARALSVQIQDTGRALGTGLLSGGDSWHGEYSERRRRLDTALAMYRGPASPAPDPALLESLLGAVTTMDRVSDLAIRQQSAEARRLFVEVLADRLGVVGRELDREADRAWESAAGRETEMRRRAETAAFALLGTGLATALSAIALGSVLARRGRRAMRALAGRVALVGRGDLVSLVPRTGLPEHDELAAALEVAMRAVRATLDEMARRVDVIAGATQLFVSSSESLAAGAQQQASAVSEISQTMERLSDAAEQIAAGAGRATRAAAEGRNAVGEAERGVGFIREAVAAAVASGLQLRHDSERVGAVATTISQIAERTHILALNAAIEAATAGEYGRRFAVVAGQVRDLAGDTRRATEQVQGTVIELRDAVRAIEANAHRAHEIAASVADQTQRAVEAMTQVASTVEMIARATTSQHGASSEMAQTMHQIVEVARASAASSRHAADSASRLRETTGQIESLIGHYRVARDTSS
ncbi:MAG: hypothetical protein FJ033_14350 [Chloroflexi bacterium]|nr:hypothetical protein [Chloroflexota bacterium]